ncbi:MAG: hypothetical protein ABR555_05660 [Pyrinomonadaceae bacterium]
MHKLVEGGKSQSDLDEPQFDDERTIQSARPVVPLETISESHRLRRRFALGGALLVALALGALAAVAISFLQQPRNQQTINRDAASEAQAEPRIPPDSANEQPADTNPSVSNSTGDEAQAEDSSERPIQRPVPGSRRVSPKQSWESGKTSGGTQPRLVDQWQERRARRVTRHEPRERDTHHRRDIFRVDEIFQGTDRPR